MYLLLMQKLYNCLTLLSKLILLILVILLNNIFVKTEVILRLSFKFFFLLLSLKSNKKKFCISYY